MARSAMAAGVDRNGLQVLDRATCLDLLATAVFGRLAYVSGGTPRVIPLNLVLDGDAVLFRLSTGGALTAITSRQLVALEVDELDPEGCCGWSVSILGAATELPAPLVDWSGTCVRSSVRGTVGRVFRVPTDHMEGRRLLSPLAPTR